MEAERIGVHGSWWRQIPGSGDVHYQPEEPADGRWQRGEEIEGLYFADSPETAWAEWYRYLSEAMLPPERALPRDLWEWRIGVEEVADLSDDGKLEDAGLPPPEPGRSQWPDYQRVGIRLWREGCRGILSPSAARPDSGLVLCIFRTERVEPGTEPLPPPQQHSTPPLVPPGLRT
jgi:RES domain-containing protein